MPLLAVTTILVCLWMVDERRVLIHRSAFILFAILAAAQVSSSIIGSLSILVIARSIDDTGGPRRHVWPAVQGAFLAAPLVALLLQGSIFEVRDPTWCGTTQGQVGDDFLHVIYAEKMRLAWAVGAALAAICGYGLARIRRLAYDLIGESGTYDNVKALRENTIAIVRITGAALSIAVLAMAALSHLGAECTRGAVPATQQTWWTKDLALALGIFLSLLLAGAYLPVAVAIQAAVKRHPTNDPAAADRPRGTPSADVLDGLKTAVPLVAPLLSALLATLGLKGG